LLLPGPGEPLDFVEPTRVAPRLATYILDLQGRVWSAHLRVVSSGSLLRSAVVQQRSCCAAARRLGGVQEASLDVYVDVLDMPDRGLGVGGATGRGATGGWCAPVARPGLVAMLEAVRRGLYDGVVVDSLPVLVGGVPEGLWIMNALCSGSCDLHVSTAPGVGLWGTQAAVFRAALQTVRQVGPLWLGSPGFAGSSFFSGSTGREFSRAGIAGVASRAVEFADRRALVLRRLGVVEEELMAGVLDVRVRALLQHRRRRLETQLRALTLSAVRADATALCGSAADGLASGSAAGASAR
jgi:hypothetical protein